MMYKINKDYFKFIDNKDKAYFLGIFYADGNNYINDKIKQASLELLLEDIKIIQILKDRLETDKPIKYRKAKVDKNNFKIKERCGLVLSSHQISEDLSKHGCIPKKTFNLKFPSEDSLSKQFYPSFIRGYFDGDGCISIAKESNIKSSICGYHPFICHLFNILKEENLNVKIYINKRIKSFSELYIQGKKDNIDFYNYLYDDSELFLNRKKQKFMNIINIKKGQG
jgi:hypothetical protein